ncbi:WG repeat-containing protein [uncultured Mucilaginibacter sp.]|uniref:WG repeat-containing protein n=1 Tax=uncultured Mucilaginibacter sp. TaxID=797541 RepID=UPI002600FC2B|nr:WG repeat-containing protein [uncultured Mucilaginibacter sp.]
MKYLAIMLFCFVCSPVIAQSKMDVLTLREDTTYKNRYGYAFVNAKGDTVLKLDTAKYSFCFTTSFKHFAVVGFRKKHGWYAIDRNEKVLFEVYNTSKGEPSPDELRENLIRAIGHKGLIGFANEKGQVVINPQFEAVTSFYKGKAIVGKTCKEVLWGSESQANDGDKHYTIDCKQAGYINKKGQILKMGNFTFEQIQKQIGWKSEFNLM